MIQFHKALEDWNSSAFSTSLKREIELLDAGSLPLEKGISQGGNVDDNNITATILNITDEDSMIKSKIGVFFTEVVGGCNCNDDPLEINAYCEILVTIDKKTATTTIIPLDN